MSESLMPVEQEWAVDWIRADANPLSVFRDRVEWVNLATEVLARRSWILTDQLGFCLVLVGSIVDDGLTIEPARAICKKLLTAEFGAKHKGCWEFYADFHDLVAKWKIARRRAHEIELRKRAYDAWDAAGVVTSLSDSMPKIPTTFDARSAAAALRKPRSDS